ncbi:MAG: hypothetical protein HYZ49_03205 [Chloroflexi bacterium]|nr:hypothetical protein [Chloroflexota bacterium]
MNLERSHILEQLASGQISADEAARLLNQPPASPASFDALAANRWFHVRVTDLDTGKQKVSVNLPLSLVDAGLKIGARYEPQIAGLDLREIIEQLQAGTGGRLVDVEDFESGEHVEIFVD